jgi:hypothetical protein
MDRVFASTTCRPLADQNAIKIIQVVIKDNGNPRPFSIVAKNLSTSHDRDIYAGILIGDEILCHVSLEPRSRQSKQQRRVSEDRLRRG